jgi:hypothetical protein
MVYVNMPLSPWVRNCQQMILKGHYYMKDVSISDDPLESSLFEMTGKHTFLYLPLYSKENALIGFLTISYKKVTNISQKNIDKAYRSIEIVEAHLND